VEDEYQIEDLDIVPADYMLRVAVSNFRNAWENMDPESERVDEYGLGARESLAEAVSAVTGILGMQPCEVSYHFSTLTLLRWLPMLMFILCCFLEHGLDGWSCQCLFAHSFCFSCYHLPTHGQAKPF
jgi:hypothetical protein